MSTTTSGLGDFNAFAAYLFKSKPGVSVGVGPQITAPTASADETGTGKWQGGLAAIYFNATSAAMQWGGLVTWQTDFAGDAERTGTSVLALQPFYILQMGKGLYARSTAIAVFDLQNDTYNVPVGIGIGQVVPTKGAIFNVFVETQYTRLAHAELGSRSCRSWSASTPNLGADLPAVPVRRSRPTGASTCPIYETEGKGG